MKNTIILMLGIILMYGCIREERTKTEAFIENKSSCKIILLFYKSGIVHPNDTLELLIGNSILLGKGYEYGDYRIPGFSSNYFGTSEDSVVVIFNDTFKVTHYAKAPDNLSAKHYLFESLRNIGNPKSYEFEMIRNKNEKVNNHYYYFTESDYEYAKD